MTHYAEICPDGKIKCDPPLSKGGSGTAYTDDLDKVTCLKCLLVVIREKSK